MSQKSISRRKKKHPATAGQTSKKPTPHYIYGLHAVRAALKNQRRKKISLHCTANAWKKLSAEDKDIAKNIDLQISSPRELDQLTKFNAVHQGMVLKVMPLPRLDINDLIDCRFVVILDQISDPHNVGAILRSACAFNADALITTARHAPGETAILAKSASGALDIVPVIEVANLGEAIKFLKKQAFWCIGLDSEADLPLAGDSFDHSIALILGAEGKGLRQKTRQLCDQMFRLDMPGEIKSLNVSNAAAIAMFALSAGTK